MQIASIVYMNAQTISTSDGTSSKPPQKIGVLNHGFLNIKKSVIKSMNYFKENVFKGIITARA